MSLNHRNPSIKRILADVKELTKHPSSRYHAAPLENDMFEWHFTIRGPSETPFENGCYHGRILLPNEYPFKPPNIVFLTKNGRFEVGTKICLSISAYHEESWQPAWGVRTMLEAIISFLPSEGAGAIGALDWTPEERKKLAIESQSYHCPTCGLCSALLSSPNDDLEGDKPDNTIIEQLSQLQMGVKKPSSDTAASVIKNDNLSNKISSAEKDNNTNKILPPNNHLNVDYEATNDDSSTLSLNNMHKMSLSNEEAKPDFDFEPKFSIGSNHNSPDASPFRKKKNSPRVSITTSTVQNSDINVADKTTVINLNTPQQQPIRRLVPRNPPRRENNANINNHNNQHQPNPNNIQARDQQRPVVLRNNQWNNSVVDVILTITLYIIACAIGWVGSKIILRKFVGV
eukprot:gene5108-7119_t